MGENESLETLNRYSLVECGLRPIAKDIHIPI
jgi:hypothetical protein